MPVTTTIRAVELCSRRRHVARRRHDRHVYVHQGHIGLNGSRHRQRLSPVSGPPDRLNSIVRGEKNLGKRGRLVVIVNDEHTARTASEAQNQEP